MDNVTAKNRKIETLKFLFLLLPPLSRLLLKELIELLSVVAEHTSNKMTSYNLGVVFAPNIVYTRQVIPNLKSIQILEKLHLKTYLFFCHFMKSVRALCFQIKFGFMIPHNFLFYLHNIFQAIRTIQCIYLYKKNN